MNKLCICVSKTLSIKYILIIGNMNGILLVAFMSLLASRYNEAVFFHERSLIPIHPEVPDNYSDFGFSMGFQTVKNNLIVGAPSADLIGKVYTCDMGKADVVKDIACQENHVNMKPCRSCRKDQHYFLGSSIAATADKFLTCAPLRTAMFQEKNGNVEEAVGKCFVFDQNGKKPQPSTVSLTYEQYMKQRANGITTDFAFIYGGTGWTTFADEDNGLFIISKTSTIKGDIVSTPIMVPEYKTFSMGLKNRLKTAKMVNLGFGVTSGKFFSNETTYAVSMTTLTMHGVIEFLKFVPTSKTLRVLNKKVSGFTIESKTMGTMFGSVLATADLNMDGFADLLVAAPVYTEDDCVECGAVHVYLGGEMASIKENLRITGIQNFGRFSTAIAARDVDGDSIPELVVSAPYEDGGKGAVYIISGRELNNKVKPFAPQTHLQISELTHVQRIHKETFRTFGFSLQFISDADANGCNELVAGSPGNGAAVLFKGIQTINVTLSCSLIGEQIVREQDPDFTIKVCAMVGYPKLPSDINANLIVTSTIIGEASEVRNRTFDIDISCTNCPPKKSYCGDVIVDLKDRERREYTFIAEAKLNTDQMLNTTEFNSAWVVTNPNYSQLKKRKEVSRYCKGDDCLPKLSMNYSWSGSESYVLGSTTVENITIYVRNDGNSSYGACLWLDVFGVPQWLVKDAALNDDYVYLRKPFRRDTQQEITLLLNMTRPINKFKEFVVKVRLLKNCNTESDTSNFTVITVPYIIPTDTIHIHGTSHSKNFTDTAIESDNNLSITDVQEYSISNNGSILWLNVLAKVSMNKSHLVRTFRATMDKNECTESHTDMKFLFICKLHLMPNSTQSIIATTEILKSGIIPIKNNAKINLTSEIELLLEPTNIVKKNNVTTYITFIKELSWANNQWLIGAIAGLIALLVLIIIIGILCKVGFFKRKQKQRLHVFRESLKVRNSRRNTHVCSVTDGQGLDMDVVVDDPFDVPTPPNNVVYTTSEEKPQGP